MSKKKNKTKNNAGKILKNFTNLIIIDASGSMFSKHNEVVGGLKSLFKSIKEDALKNPANITTIITDFSSSSDFNVLVNTNNLNELTDDIAEKYATRGMTALYDAMGSSFKLVPENQDGVFVNILTDGEENDSKRFSSSDIKELIAEGKQKNWVITFMGTTENAIHNAVNLGVSRGNTMVFQDSAAGVAVSASAANYSRSAYYTSVVGSTSTSAIDTENLFSTDNDSKNE